MGETASERAPIALAEGRPEDPRLALIAAFGPENGRDRVGWRPPSRWATSKCGCRSRSNR